MMLQCKVKNGFEGPEVVKAEYSKQIGKYHETRLRGVGRGQTTQDVKDHVKQILLLYVK